jgi:hypothetical protein
MKAIFVAIGTFLYERVWLSRKSTILGLLVYILGEVIIYFQGPSASPYARLIAGLVAAPFLAWKDKAVAEGAIKLIALFLFVSFGAQAAAGTPSGRTAEAASQLGIKGTLADVAPSDPLPTPAVVAPKFGGCTKTGAVCFGPSVAVSMVAINFSSKKIEGAFAPGLGYGFTWKPGAWDSFGADAFFVLDPGAQQASASVVFKLVNGYLRVGISKGFIGDTSWRMPVGVGVDL